MASVIHEASEEEIEEVLQALNDKTGSAVELWGGSELQHKIYAIIKSGGKVDAFFVDISGGDVEELYGMPPELAGATLSGIDADGVFGTLGYKAVKRAKRFLNKGWKVIGYCDNVDQAEIIIAQIPDTFELTHGDWAPEDVAEAALAKARHA